MPRKKTAPPAADGLAAAPAPAAAAPARSPSSSEREVLQVEGDLTIYCAAQARELWLQWLLAGRGDATLDLGRVADCDSAGVQLLLAARASLAEQGEALALRNVSQPVREALLAYGLGTDPATWRAAA